MRGNASLTRPAYIEAGFASDIRGGWLSPFRRPRRPIHASCFGPSADAAHCALERWREAGAKENLSLRDRLRDGVEAALLAFLGFLIQTPALRERLKDAKAPSPDFGQLLRLIDRLIFLLVVKSATSSTRQTRRQRLAGSIWKDIRSRGLGQQAIRRAAWDRHHDLWEGSLVTFRCACAWCNCVSGSPPLAVFFSQS